MDIIVLMAVRKLKCTLEKAKHKPRTTQATEGDLWISGCASGLWKHKSTNHMHSSEDDGEQDRHTLLLRRV